MNRGRNIVLVAAGIMIGMALSGPAVQAASGILAERSAQAVYVDGRKVELEAYNIGGNNYVKLRDIGAAADFNVYWDGAVQIDTTAPYTGEAPKAAHPAEIPETMPEPESQPNATKENTDFSVAANPEIFCGPYTREAYNAAYTVLWDHDRTGTVHYASDADRQQMENLLAELANGTTLSLRGIGDGAYEIYAHTIDWSIADEATEDFIREASGLSTDREKVLRINDWICDHMIYNPKKVVGVNEVASSPSPVEGNCSSFARMMNYLCGRLGIPCIRVHGESHYWNLLYVDGAWSYTDASVNDQVSSRAALLFSNTTRKQIDDPAGLRFLQEFLVPQSTK